MKDVQYCLGFYSYQYKVCICASHSCFKASFNLSHEGGECLVARQKCTQRYRRYNGNKIRTHKHNTIWIDPGKERKFIRLTFNSLQMLG